jgi:hypothetical protein
MFFWTPWVQILHVRDASMGCWKRFLTPMSELKKKKRNWWLYILCVCGYLDISITAHSGVISSVLRVLRHRPWPTEVSLVIQETRNIYQLDMSWAKILQLPWFSDIASFLCYLLGRITIHRRGEWFRWSFVRRPKRLPLDLLIPGLVLPSLLVQHLFETGWLFLFSM